MLEILSKHLIESIVWHSRRWKNSVNDLTKMAITMGGWRTCSDVANSGLCILVLQVPFVVLAKHVSRLTTIAFLHVYARMDRY